MAACSRWARGAHLSLAVWNCVRAPLSSADWLRNLVLDQAGARVGTRARVGERARPAYRPAAAYRGSGLGRIDGASSAPCAHDACVGGESRMRSGRPPAARTGARPDGGLGGDHRHDGGVLLMRTVGTSARAAPEVANEQVQGEDGCNTRAGVGA